MTFESVSISLVSRLLKIEHIVVHGNAAFQAIYNKIQKFLFDRSSLTSAPLILEEWCRIIAYGLVDV